MLVEEAGLRSVRDEGGIWRFDWQIGNQWSVYGLYLDSFDHFIV